MNNYFELFTLASDFSINRSKLEQTYQQLVSSNHPDKFTNATKVQQNKALSNTALINTAYQTLADDLNRASYLLELADINAFDEHNTQMDGDFLTQQITYQEQLEQLIQTKDIDSIESFITTISNLEKQHIANISKNFKEKNLDIIKNLVRELRFYQQIKKQANRLIDEIL